MSGTIIHDLTLISTCDADDWDGGAGSLDSDSQIQGSACLSITYPNPGLKDPVTETITLTDMTGKNIFGWLTFARLAMLQTKANGGLRLVAKDDTGKMAQWFIGGRDTLSTSGWTCYTVNCDITPDEVDTGFDKTKVTKVGWRVYLSIKGFVKWDAWRFGTYIGIKGGTSTSPATLEDVWQEENADANKFGLLTKIEGVYFLQAKFKIGSTTAGEETYFSDRSQVIIFRDSLVPGGFYEITFQGNATATTEIHFGEEVGGKGVSGLFIKSTSPTRRFVLDATDTNNMRWSLCGTTFYQAGRIRLPAFDENRKVVSCTFEACREIWPDTTKMQYCNFIGPSGEDPARACRVSYSGTLRITDSNFINCSRALNVTVDGTVTVTLSNLRFSGNTYDIEKSSPTGDLTIENTNGSDASTSIVSGGGTVSIVTIVTLTVRRVKSGHEPNEYVRCAIYRKSDMYEIMNKDATETDELNTGYYKATATFTQVGFAVIVRAREKGWLPFETEVTLTSAGLDVTAIWVRDLNYNP